jgi:hypothetical protein
MNGLLANFRIQIPRQVIAYGSSNNDNGREENKKEHEAQEKHKSGELGNTEFHSLFQRIFVDNREPVFEMYPLPKVMFVFVFSFYHLSFVRI